MVVTDAELVPLDDGLDIVINVADDVLDTMIPLVRDMHASSGLTEAVRASTTTLGTAETRVLDYVRSHVPEARTAPLCGNSIATDRGFLARDMPKLDGHLHYRMIDVSSIKELAKRWYPASTSRSRRRAWHTAPSPTSARASRSSCTTGKPCSWRRLVPPRSRRRRPPGLFSRLGSGG